MTEADVEGVREVEVRSFPNPWSSKAFISELRDNSYSHYIVACVGGRVVGYAGMWRLFNEAHITNIAVHPEFRRSGVGQLLLSTLIEHARRFGMTSMTLEVRPSNEAALALYRKQGFVQRGVRRRYYSDNQEDALIMWKDPL